MSVNLIVVDDFYSDPFRVRKVAIGAQYKDVRNLNYPGLQSVRTFSSDSIKEAFRALVGKKICVDEKMLTFGRFRVMSEGKDTRLKIHADGGADWTGVIYLNLPNQCRGGTAFYRHKETGLEGPPSAAKAAALGFDNSDSLGKSLIERDSLNSDSWNQTMYVAMRFNRLVLFRGSEMFHSHTCSWGSRIEDSRLTQNFFFLEAPTVPR